MNDDVSLKPFLLRAYNDWIVACGGTPHLLVQADLPHVEVPQNYVDPEDGTILFNIAADATNKLVFNNQGVFFQARFNGIVCDVKAPFYAIRGLYAIDDESGIFFDSSEQEIEQEIAMYEKNNQAKVVPHKLASTAQKTKPPFLRVITNEESE